MIYEINGVQLDIDMADVDFIEKYEAAFEKMAASETNLPMDEKNSVIASAYVKMFYELFDDIFGKGMGEKIFSKKRNINLCLSTYDQFFDICTKQTEENNEKLTAMFAKYMPQQRK